MPDNMLYVFMGDLVICNLEVTYGTDIFSGIMTLETETKVRDTIKSYGSTSGKVSIKYKDKIIATLLTDWGPARDWPIKYFGIRGNVRYLCRVFDGDGVETYASFGVEKTVVKLCSTTTEQYKLRSQLGEAMVEANIHGESIARLTYFVGSTKYTVTISDLGALAVVKKWGVYNLDDGLYTLHKNRTLAFKAVGFIPIGRQAIPHDNSTLINRDIVFQLKDTEIENGFVSDDRLKDLVKLHKTIK